MRLRATPARSAWPASRFDGSILLRPEMELRISLIAFRKVCRKLKSSQWAQQRCAKDSRGLLA